MSGSARTRSRGTRHGTLLWEPSDDHDYYISRERPDPIQGMVRIVLHYRARNKADALEQMERYALPLFEGEAPWVTTGVWKETGLGR